jgi:hypothetical protein
MSIKLVYTYALAKHQGSLCRQGRTSLSEAAVQALAQLQGDLYLGDLNSLSSTGAQALATYQDELHIPRHLSNLVNFHANQK